MLPDGFDDIYLCELLDLTYTELVAQPFWWVERKRLWEQQKARARAAQNPPNS